ncbi:MAG: transcriptional regulator [Deltaproteobacteria bacterium HGW-Deltaproteobacteria-19]|jgi:CRP/FNR family transcriptional regulator|nr:MAG: transcriptional regulator [Deltaproteobacteria bacterium HGW-Deltaproteobacteria-19]
MDKPAIDRTDRLSLIPLFAGLPRPHLEALTGIAVPRTVPAGRRIFSEGEEGRGFYAILTGRVKIFKLSPEGKEQILHLFSPGEIFGEVAVFTGQGYPAHAAAERACSLLFFPREAFVGLIRGDASLALGMLAVLSVRLRRFTRMVEDLSLKEVPGRLAAHLLYRSGAEKKEVVELDLSKTQLAALLGTIPETLSRILTRMGRRGLIRTQGSRIAILDRAGLETIASEGGKLP